MSHKIESYVWDPKAEVSSDLEHRTKERITELRTALTSWCPFFGHLLLKLRPVITNKMPTMGVNPGRDLFINPFFTEMLSDKEVLGVLAHEVLHPAMLYWERMGSRKVIVTTANGQRSSLWNICHDYAINMVVDDFAQKNQHLALPPGGLLDRKYQDWSAEEIYDELLSNCEEGEAPGSEWGQGDCEGDGQGKGEGEGEDENDGRGMSEAQQRENENFWRQSIIEAAQTHERQKRGTLPASIQKIVNEILDPKVPWIDVLSRWVGENGRRQDLSYMRPNRRSESIGEMLPILVKQGVDDVCVLWDTSGSMSGTEKEVLAEVGGICDDLCLSIRIICIDCVIHSDTQDIQSAIQVLDEGIIKGGGGSDFTPAFDKLVEDQFQGVVLAFTDGMIGVPSLKPELIRDVLWVLWHTDRPPTEAWGEVLRVDDDGNAKR